MKAIRGAGSGKTLLLKRAVAFLFVFGLGVSAATAINLPPKYRTIEVSGEDALDGEGTFELGSGDGIAAAGAGQDTGGQTATRKGGTTTTSRRDLKCEAGKNGGPTDVGVTGNAIKVAANIVRDGTGASFLGEAIIGMQSVIDEANVRGICGRKILLTPRNDSWERDRGLSYIENYIHDGFFGLVVNPSSEGLDAAVINGSIDRAGIPVVGSDGMLISQYRYMQGSVDLARWVWPVAASTVSTMHIIVQHGVENGAQTFGLVYDNQYKFGVEGAQAFANSIERFRAEGRDVRLVKSLGIEPGRTSYNTEAGQFNDPVSGCGTDLDRKCDLVAMLLDSSTAITWIKAGGTFGSKITTGPQTLFNNAFAVGCAGERNSQGQGRTCDLLVWTGYNPPVDQLRSVPDVAKYIADLKSRNSKADEYNSFTQGAYLGTKVFVHALEMAGPDLTRENLRKALDSLTYSSDLTNQLVWRPGQHFANTAMQGFRIGSTQEKGFTGWQPANTGWVKDRWVGTL